MQPWGFIEVVGYVPAIAAADTMTKAAKVELAGTEVIGGGYVKGDIAAVRTAVDAGTEAARSVGQVHCAHVIALPSEGAEKVLSLNIAD